jgi:hypothetical protein
MEELISQVSAVPNVPECSGPTNRPQTDRTRRVLGESLRHRLLLHPQNLTICHCACSRHAEGLTCEASFAEKIAAALIPKYAHGGFLAIFAHGRESYLPGLGMKHGIAGLRLREDGSLLPKAHHVFRQSVFAKKAARRPCEGVLSDAVGSGNRATRYFGVPPNS